MSETNCLNCIHKGKPMHLFICNQCCRSNRPDKWEPIEEPMEAYLLKVVRWLHESPHRPKTRITHRPASHVCCGIHRICGGGLMAELNLSIIMSDGRTVVVCPNKDKIEFPEALDFTPEEMKYVLETANDFIEYCMRGVE